MSTRKSFPVGLVQCESNFLGIANGGGVSVGSGGWSNILEKFLKAKTYCDHPFETRHVGTRKIQVLIADEWIGDRRNGDSTTETRAVRLFSQWLQTEKIGHARLDLAPKRQGVHRRNSRSFD